MKTIILMDVSGVAYQTINRLTGYGGKNIPKIIKAGRKYLELESEQEEFLNQFHEELSKMSSIISPLNVTDIFFVLTHLEKEVSDLDYIQITSRQKQKKPTSRFVNKNLSIVYKDTMLY